MAEGQNFKAYPLGISLKNLFKFYNSAVKVAQSVISEELALGD